MGYIERNIHRIVERDDDYNTSCQRLSIVTEMALRGVSINYMTTKELENKYGVGEATKLRSLQGIISMFDNPGTFRIRKPAETHEMVRKTTAAILRKGKVGQRFLVSSGRGNDYPGHNIHAEIVQEGLSKRVLYRDGLTGKKSL